MLVIAILKSTNVLDAVYFIHIHIFANAFLHIIHVGTYLHYAHTILALEYNFSMLSIL